MAHEEHSKDHHAEHTQPDEQRQMCVYASNCHRQGTHQCPACQRWYCDACRALWLPIDRRFWVDTAMICVQCHYNAYGNPARSQETDHNGS